MCQKLGLGGRKKEGKTQGSSCGKVSGCATEEETSEIREKRECWRIKQSKSANTDTA